jgi:spermidine/putrescine transport system permease protein
MTVRAAHLGASRKDGGRRRAPALLLLPAALWYALFLLAPLAVLAVVSLGVRAPHGGYEPGLTLDQYQNLASRLTPFINTVVLAFWGTLGCLLVAYPLAYALASRGGSYKTALMALIVIPLWTSFLIRTYAWMFILGSNGIPQVLENFGFGQIQLLNTPFAVVLGIIYNYLPLMALPIYVSLERLDRSLLEASRDLGASSLATFRQVTLPLSAPGVISGALLVFIPVMGEYLIPVLLGGGKTYFLGNALADLFLQSRNWPFGSALATAFIVVMVVVVGIYTWATRRLASPGREGGLL